MQKVQHKQNLKRLKTKMEREEAAGSHVLILCHCSL